MLPTALLYAAVSAANTLSELGAPIGLDRQLLWLEDVAILAVPLAFLGGLLRSRLARYGVGELVVELGTAVGGELRSALSRALGDPSVEIAYWKTDLEGDDEGYVDADGYRIELPSDDPNRAVTVITRADEPIGALVHDPALREEPGLLDAVRRGGRSGHGEQATARRGPGPAGGGECVARSHRRGGRRRAPPGGAQPP